MEIVLIILGLIVFTISFLLPAGRKNNTQEAPQLSENVIREMIEKEMEGAKSQINDIVDETITYAIEKTERSMDRLTNEKMLAVNEYSDTVIGEINKNHKEVVFLYDMLNDKHENLKSTVSEAVKAAGEVKQTVKDVESLAKETEVAQSASAQANVAVEQNIAAEQSDFKPIAAKKVEIIHQPSEELQGDILESLQEKPAQKTKATKTAKTTKVDKAKSEEKTAKKLVENGADVAVILNAAGRTGGRNSNERILELHKAGKSNMAIAKELGLGIGEVKLVIDLFEGM